MSSLNVDVFLFDFLWLLLLVPTAMHVTAKCKELRSLVVNDLNSLDSTTLLHILSILAGRQKKCLKKSGKTATTFDNVFDPEKGKIFSKKRIAPVYFEVDYPFLRSFL
jgi:hypothetical protein